jgi:hypothetical protein
MSGHCLYRSYDAPFGRPNHVPRLGNAAVYVVERALPGASVRPDPSDLRVMSGAEAIQLYISFFEEITETPWFTTTD